MKPVFEIFRFSAPKSPISSNHRCSALAECELRSGNNSRVVYPSLRKVNVPRTITLATIIVAFSFYSCQKLKDNLQVNELDLPNAISATDYTLSSGTDWNFSNIKEDTLFVINSNTELTNFITGNAPQSVDFTQYSLLFAHGRAYGSISNVEKSFVRLSNNYMLNVGITLDTITADREWHLAVLVPKLANNTAVAFNLYYPHLEVWECVFDFWSPPDVIITLALDTLQKYYYTSTIPQDLSYLDNPYSMSTILFADGVEGEYSIYDHSYTDNNVIITVKIIQLHQDFVKTMFSQDSMLLKYAGHFYGNPITNYLFTKQN